MYLQAQCVSTVTANTLKVQGGLNKQDIVDFTTLNPPICPSKPSYAAAMKGRCDERMSVITCVNELLFQAFKSLPMQLFF